MSGARRHFRQSATIRPNAWGFDKLTCGTIIFLSPGGKTWRIAILPYALRESSVYTATPLSVTFDRY